MRNTYGKALTAKKSAAASVEKKSYSLEVLEKFNTNKRSLVIDRAEQLERRVVISALIQRKFSPPHLMTLSIRIIVVKVLNL